VDVANLVINSAVGVTSIIAIVLALVAYRTIAVERRIVFELEILRQLLGEGINYNGLDAPHKRAMLACLPPGDLPLWRLAVRELDSRPAPAEANAPDIREALRVATGTDEQPGTMVFDRVVTLAMADEVRAAIEHRLAVPRRPWWRPW
jgi:hypothetical protein